MGVFTWTIRTFRNTFQKRDPNYEIGICDVNYVVFTWATNAFPITIWICALRVMFWSYYGNPRALSDPCAYAWLQLAFFKCTRTNNVPKQLCVHMDQNSGFLGGSWSKTPSFSRFKTRFKSLIWKSFLFTWAIFTLSNQEKAELRLETSYGTRF